MHAIAERIVVATQWSWSALTRGLVAYLLIGASSCSNTESKTKGQSDLMIFAASSLREGFEELAQEFRRSHPGVRVSFNFAGTQELRSQIEHGALADVIASADLRHMNALERAHLVGPSIRFTRNEPVVIRGKASGVAIRGLQDLPAAGCIVIGAPEVPIGAYTSRILDRATGLFGQVLTSCSSVVIVLLFGTPLAWSVARAASPRARLVEGMLELPIVVPPAVAGIALLLAFGRRGVLAAWLYPSGWSLSFTTAAVVVAEVFVSAPLYLQTAIQAFRRIDEGTIVVARSLGASPTTVFFRVAIPLAGPGLRAGAAMAWARALGEFGATLMFAGNLQGETQTLPLAIYSALESDLHAVKAMSVLLVLVALATLLLTRSLEVAREHSTGAT